MSLNTINETEPGEIVLEFMNDPDFPENIDWAMFDDEINDVLYSAINLVEKRPQLVDFEKMKSFTEIEDGLDEDGRDVLKKLTRDLLKLAKPARKARPKADEPSCGM